MRDVFDFTSPWGPLGVVADILVLRRYMSAFLQERARVLRELAESTGDDTV